MSDSGKPASIEIRHNTTAHRFEASVDGELSILEYEEIEGKLILVHTEVPRPVQKRGIAGELAKAALDFARSESRKVDPRCPFVAEFVRKHAGYGDLVATEGSAPAG